ncbi:MAG: hypothetical protein IMF26_07005 [Candidatus Fermentithermobacillus carboniphilus]|uniref:DUF370 domain-containing protein n=1 Tax=Candidatus Fermentithermobacillus carboniphilus TaxID=3085328 RepID=A0AAT9LAP2_9FIRM|nr:MAG: hypothetical protein IMF26_07005 [Candidatus Fermentithermobacillus carboniphilus]
MSYWVDLTGEKVVVASEIVLVLDWTTGKDLPINREFVSHARACGLMVPGEIPQKSLLVTRDRVYLLPVSTRTIERHMRNEHRFAPKSVITCQRGGRE